MKRILNFAVVGALFGLSLVGQSTAQASTLQAENLVLTLPDSVSISGTEIGGSNNPRKCSIKASLDSKPGTTIPLRAGAVVNLVDATGFGIDNGYAIADVEGLTHLDIVMVFKCGNGSGTATLKGPYKFTTIWRGISGLPFGADTPVNVTFGSSTPTPTTSTSDSNSSKDSLNSSAEQISALTKTNSEMQSKILELVTQINSLKSQLEAASKTTGKNAPALSKDFINCYRIAKNIAISKKGNLPKQCLNL